jgi:nucleotide-binding universal stress UspA family protein
MPDFKHILFPVDFSDRCRAVEPFVTSMVKQFQARLSLLHVISIPAGWYGNIEAPYPVTFDLSAVVEAGEKQLAAYLAASPMPQIDRIVKRGDAADEITAFAQEQNVDLIMMPTRGYGKFRSLLVGSVTAKVLHDVDCPVWTAAHTEDPATFEDADCRSMLCAIDLVPESAGLVRYAAELAKRFQADLRLVHAAPAPEILAMDPREAAFRRNLLEWTRERIAVLQRQAGTDFEVCLEGGRPSSVVRAAALHHDADMVVIGRGRGQQAFGRLRSNSHAIICESPCPVLRA